ncbi:hypothetical protein BD779DRAFT_1422597, partial [Infundibulicybe gibba]
LGMPIMIRTNSATELCITRGQEGLVYGWQAEIGSRGQNVLGVLFVRLVNPPQQVQFDDLPRNVVPIMRTSSSTLCYLPDDSTVNITRCQVEVLPNFSMTDYASQGKTRAYNVVDLNNSYLHQSYYTALSRSASAAGTVILQGFDARKITGGASGALRQEFRDLEILDEITRLTYEGILPPAVTGDRRGSLIMAYRGLKGDSYVPENVHHAIRWSKSDPYVVTDPMRGEDEPGSVPTTNAEGSLSKAATGAPTRVLKRKVSASAVQQGKATKKTRTNYQAIEHEHLQHNMPLGTRWQSNSCAYDATVSILYNVWRDDTSRWTEMFRTINLELMGLLATGFMNHENGLYTLENVRDFFHRALDRSAPGRFGWGEFTSVHSVIDRALHTSVPVLSSDLTCTNGHVAARPNLSVNGCMINAIVTHESRDSNGGFRVNASSICTSCGADVYRQFSYIQAPPLLAFDIAGCGSRHVIEDSLSIAVNNQIWTYALRGVIYHGHGHFTARVITADGIVWYHDGMDTE